VENEEKDMLPQVVLDKYEKWYNLVTEATHQLDTDPEFQDSEDLGDWVTTISTLLSFGPNPKSWQ
jgi:hypothetical protein